MGRMAKVQKLPVVDGITVGSIKHKLLLALRPGGAHSSQLSARYDVDVSHPLHRLCSEGLIDAAGDKDGRFYRLTEKGRELVREDGPLSRRNGMNTQHQL